MAAQAAALWCLATQALLPRPAPASKTVHAHFETRNTAIPVRDPPAAQALRAARPYRHRAKAVRVGTLRYASHSQAKRLTARNSSSRVNGFVTYPSAPCCSPQYLSLAESLLVTRITGIVLNSLLLFSSRQT